MQYSQWCRSRLRLVGSLQVLLLSPWLFQLIFRCIIVSLTHTHLSGKVHRIEDTFDCTLGWSHGTLNPAMVPFKFISEFIRTLFESACISLTHHICVIWWLDHPITRLAVSYVWPFKRPSDRFHFFTMSCYPSEETIAFIPFIVRSRNSSILCSPIKAAAFLVRKKLGLANWAMYFIKLKTEC